MGGTGSGDDGNDGETPVGGPPPDAEQAPPPQGDLDPRKVTAKLGYEMGQPLRTVGAQAGVSEAAVRQWARELGWVRGQKSPKSRNPLHRKDPSVTTAANKAASNVIDMPGLVRVAASQSASQNSPCEAGEDAKCEVDDEKPLDVLFRERVRELLECPTRDEAADVAARAVVQVVHGHRRGLVRAKAIVERLMSQLEIAADSRDLLETLIEETTEPGKKRAAMLRLVSLPAHAGTIKDLTTAMQKLVLLERQAFGLGLSDDPTPPPPPPEVAKVEDATFARIRERAMLRIATSQPAEAAK